MEGQVSRLDFCHEAEVILEQLQQRLDAVEDESAEDGSPNATWKREAHQAIDNLIRYLFD